MPEAIFLERDDPKHSYIVSGNTYEWYWSIGKVFGPRRIAEVGVRYGYSLASLVFGAIAAGGFEWAEGWDICGYDPESNEKCRKNLHRHIDPNRLAIHLRKPNTQPVPSGQFDLVHIDAQHNYEVTKPDLMQAMRCDPRVILCDDYISCPDDRRACDEFAREYAAFIAETFLIQSDRGLWGCVVA